MIILGIDPGSRITGFGLIDNQANRITYIASGNIKVKGDNLPQRLGNARQGVIVWASGCMHIDVLRGDGIMLAVRTVGSRCK